MSIERFILLKYEANGMKNYTIAFRSFSFIRQTHEDCVFARRYNANTSNS